MLLPCHRLCDGLRRVGLNSVQIWRTAHISIGNGNCRSPKIAYCGATGWSFLLVDRLLDELHVHHSGSSRMKGIARSHFWWPKLDAAIEDIAKSCSTCQQMQDKPAAAPLHTWIWPETPWYRLHIDFAELDSKHFLVLVDAHSKWIEVVYMPSTTKASATIQVLRDIFAVHGLPVELVSDNGPPFASEEFATFTRQNGIRHIRSPPFHPSTNGAAERAVKTF